MLIIFDYICLYCRLACIFLRVLFCIRIIMYELKSLESIDNLPTIRIGVDPTFKAYQNVQVCRLKNAPRDFICTDFSSGACFNMLVRHCLGATISCARLRVPECFLLFLKLLERDVCKCEFISKLINVSDMFVSPLAACNTI